MTVRDRANKGIKILLLGASGQLGKELQRQKPESCTLVRVDSPNADDDRDQPEIIFDLCETDKVGEFIADIKPDIVINAAAYTAVEQAEDEVELAFKINAEAPKKLAQACQELNALLFHYSTDYVFDGSKDRPWVESDRPCPLNAYGRSKLAGDQAVLSTCARSYVFRTSWVFSPSGKNFVKTMLRLGKTHKAMTVINDQIGAPTSARFLAQMSYSILTSSNADLLKKSGLYNSVCAGYCSWYDFACEIFRLAPEYGFELAVDSVEPIAAKDYPGKTTRPLNSRLDSSKLETAFGIKPPHWREELKLVLSGLAQDN